MLEPQRFSQATTELGVSGGLTVAIGIVLVILRPYLRPMSAANEP
jgi:hypothetical protein